MSKPSPRNCRTLRLMERTGATINVSNRGWGQPKIGEWGDEARAIGSQIGLTRANVSKLLKEGWIEQISENEHHMAEYAIADKGRLVLVGLHEGDFEPSKPYFDAKQIKAILYEWHRSDYGWFFLTELAIDGRRIDGFALGVWESTMYQAIAYEIKINRGDLLADINDSEKRRPAMSFSHQFYYVTTRGLSRGLEIPSDVGLIEIDRAKRRHVLIDAPVRDIENPDWSLIGAICLKALKDYYRHFDWNKYEWVGEDRPLPGYRAPTDRKGAIT